jgi:crotonobetainyl-CoA:carnitine CoA-transferase CaiB-like acyl-CoA transferase
LPACEGIQNNCAVDDETSPDAANRRAKRTLTLPGHGIASDYARALLASLGVPACAAAGPDDESPALAWATSGLMALTGAADGAALMCPVPLASCADGAIRALAHIVPAAHSRSLPAGRALLGERAAIAGLHRNGAISPGGGCRLLSSADSWIAVSLARDCDWSAVPAWLEDDHATSWEHIAAVVATGSAPQLVERARLLGLAACVSALPGHSAGPWYRAVVLGAPAPASRRLEPPKVLDLSSLWAGPLCSHLLQHLGAHVIKVESVARPDGAREGPPQFHDLLNCGKRSVALDFDRQGIGRLHELIDRADIVIEASRPRGLRQLGVFAEECVARRSGLTWVSITGHGREEPQAGWIAYGDDAGVAAGLSALMERVAGRQFFCGDAIADPLTGIHAALAALAAHGSGGGRLVSLALQDVVAHCAAFSLPSGATQQRERWNAWDLEARSSGREATPPAAREAAGRARALGADNDRALDDWGVAC